MKKSPISGGSLRSSFGRAAGRRLGTNTVKEQSKSSNDLYKERGYTDPAPLLGSAIVRPQHREPVVNPARKEVYDDITYNAEMAPFDASESGSYSANNALWTAYASALVYAEPEVIKHVVLDLWGWTECECFGDEMVGVSAFGMYNESACIIAAAGDFSDVAMLDWTKKPNCNSDKPFFGFKEATLHHGYNFSALALATAVRRFILRAREANPRLPVFLTGHSVGGTIATVLLAYCTFNSNMKLQLDYYKRALGQEVAELDVPERIEPIPITALYSFGSPRVGSLGFRKALKDTIPHTQVYRIMNTHDHVPEMPGSEWFHCGTRVVISEEGLTVGKSHTKVAMEKYKADVRASGYATPDFKFHQIRFYLFTLEQYFNAYLAELQMKKSLQSSFTAFPEPRTPPKPKSAVPHPIIVEEQPPAPAASAPRKPHPQFSASVQHQPHKTTTTKPLPAVPLSKSTPGIKPQPRPTSLKRPMHKSDQANPVAPTVDTEYVQTLDNIIPEKVEVPKTSPRNATTITTSNSRITLKQTKQEEKEKYATIRGTGKLGPPQVGRNRHGVFFIDSRKKKTYPIFHKLIFLDEKLKMKNAIAEQEPNDTVCYVILWRLPALAHGGPIKFKVTVDGEFLELHPLANGSYLFLGLGEGKHTIELELPGSLTSKTNKKIETDHLQGGELQIIEIKIGGKLIPNTKVSLRPKINFHQIMLEHPPEKKK